MDIEYQLIDNQTPLFLQSSVPVSVSTGLRWSILLISTTNPTIPGKVSKWPNIASPNKANIIDLMSRPNINKVMNLMLTFNATDEV